MFDRYENQLRVFQLVGVRYQALAIVNQRFWFEELGLGLGVWQGRYQGAEGQWLRWYGGAGQWLPTPAEQMEQERLRAEQAEAKLVQAARSLLAQGMVASEVATVLAMTMAEVETLEAADLQ